MNTLMPSKERSFTLRLFAYFKGQLSDSLSGKVVSLTTVLLVGFWESCVLLHLRRVLNFFLCFWSELATDEVVHAYAYAFARARALVAKSDATENKICNLISAEKATFQREKCLAML